MEKSLLILGAGDLGQVVAEMAADQYDRIAFLDDQPTRDKEEQYPVIGGLDALNELCGEFTHAIPAYGNPAFKDQIRKRIKDCGLAMPKIIHPSAIISPSAILHDGVIIRENVVISRKAEIGECALINMGVLIDHGCVIGACSHLPMGMIVRNAVKIPDCSSFRPGEVLE